jgi:hypothetical protein
MPNLTVRTSVSGFATGSGYTSIDADAGELAAPASVPAAVSGTLTTRTDNDTGTLTMSTGHGITTGQRVDFYWTGGTRYGVTVGTVSGNSVPFDLGAGDNLPIATTAITVGKPVQTAFDLTGDDLTALFAGGNGAARAYFVFADAESDLYAILLAANGPPFAWPASGTNVLAELLPLSVWISHDGASAKTTLQCAGLRE